MKNTVEIRGLCKSYPDGEKILPVLDGLDLELGRGGSLAIEGESGSGKSTLLRIIGSLDKSFSGSVTVCGEDMKALDDRGTQLFRSKKIGFVFQRHFFLPQFTVLENVLLPSLGTGADASERALFLLESVGVIGLKDRFPGEISGGELQRAAVARALVNSPDLLIADEPSGALDKRNADALMELLQNLNEGGLSIITATHSDRLAKSMKRQCRLEGGTLKF